MTIKKSFFLCGILLLLLILSSPLSASAAEEFHLIYCATHWNFVGPPPAGQAPATAFCTTCDLLKLLETGFNFIWIYLSIPLGAIMMLYGGFLMVLPSFTGSSNQATRGRKVLLNAFVGFAIVFFAWIGVDSILKIMGAQFGTGQIVKLGPWNKIECDAPTVPIPAPGSLTSPERERQPPAPTFDGGPKFTEAGARKFTDDNHIGVKTGVILSGVKQGTLETTADTKSQCRCEIVITSATEGQHASGEFSHANGDKVDIRRNAQLDSFIQNNYRYIGRRPGDGAGLYVNDTTGALYAKESNHWDVLNGNSWEMSRKTKK